MKQKAIIPFILLFLFSFDSLSDLGMEWMLVVCLISIASCILFHLALSEKKILLMELSRILHWFYMAAFAGCFLITYRYWSGVLANLWLNFPIRLFSVGSSILVIILSIVVLIVQNKAIRLLSDLPLK